MNIAASGDQTFKKASAGINEDRLRRICLDLASAHSPTGAELPAAKVVAQYFEAAGIETTLQHLTPESANVFGRLRGTGGGPSLLLYAPIDTHLEADPAIDVPAVGRKLRPDMLPFGHERDGFVVGLGASNPKGMAATMMEAALALHESKVSLRGDIIIAFGAGGMPIQASNRGNRGISDGLYHMLTRGVCADFAIVMKPGTGVDHEEPGLCWFRVSVRALFGYAGIPRSVMPNSILPAAKMIQELEEMAPDLHHAQHARAGRAARRDHRVTRRLARPARLHARDHGDLSRHPLRPAYAAG